MRKVIDLQLEFWKKDIADIQFDFQSRDEIPKLLLGLQHIYCTRKIREAVFKVLNRIVPKKTVKPADQAWTYGKFWCWAPCG